MATRETRGTSVPRWAFSRGVGLFTAEVMLAAEVMAAEADSKT
jgi:hypothetical protein